MARKALKLSTSQKSFLFEAYRRNQMADKHERSKPLGARWLGLGTAAAYRPMLHAGLMEFHDLRHPPQRCMGWLVLTNLGIRALRQCTPEFKEVYARLAADPRYQSSYLSHYQLVGGITRR